MDSRPAFVRHRYYFALFFCLVSLRGMDLWITYQLTPDLALEWNPLVTHLKFSWSGLLLTQVALVSLTMVGFHYYLRRARNPVDLPGLTIHQFVYYYFNGHEPTWKNMATSFFKIPSQRYRSAQGAFIGFVLVGSFALTSLFAVAHNWLILQDVWIYLDFVVQYHHVYFPLVFFVIVAVAAVTFFLSEYRVYRRTFE